MRYEDLPENWNTLPLDDGPLAAGVIDLVLGPQARLDNTLLVLPCDDYDVGLPCPMHIGGTDWSEPASRRREMLALHLDFPVPGFVIALSSRFQLPERAVRGWRRAIEDTLDASGKALLALGVADLDTVTIVGGRATRNGSLRATAS